MGIQVLSISTMAIQKVRQNNLIHRSYFDPYTGFPGYKSYFCNIEKLDQRERKRKEEAEVTGDDGANEI